MIVNVTQEHINKGTEASCTRCPIALALRDAFEIAHVLGVDVWPRSCRIGFRTIKLPQEAIDFINIFDSYGPDAVKPFTFEVDYDPV